MADLFADLWQCGLNGWRPDIGNDGVSGWVLTALYALAVAGCLMSLTGPGASPHLRHRLFWAAAAAVLLVLGLNVQLDLQTLLRRSMRCVSHLQLWYDDRQPVKEAVVILAGVTGVLALALAAWMLRGSMRRFALPLAGLALVCAYVVARAVYFTDMDYRLGHNPKRRLAVALTQPTGLILLIAGTWWPLWASLRFGRPQRRG
jgi:hypothetical protein